MTATLMDDIRWAFRVAVRRPLFSFAVVTTLAVSIAAATTAFGLAEAVLWRALPFAGASQLVFVWEEVERDGQRHPSRVTGSRYSAWRDSSSAVFSSLSVFGAAGFTLESDAGARAIRGVRVSTNYFSTLGIAPALGRAFNEPDGLPGRDQVVILADALWRDQFGGRVDAVGQSIRLSGRPYIVIGVMPPVRFPAWPVNPAIVTIDPDAQQFWVPIPRTTALDQSSRSHVFGVVARLAPGVSAAQAEDVLRRATDTTAPDAHGARLSPFRDQFVDSARTPLMALAGAALAVLLIACANLAALYISAFEGRRGELALRAAIGAGAMQLVRQLAIEALLLSIAAGVAGIALARSALATLPAWLPASIPFLTMPMLDVRVAGVAAMLALVATVALVGWPTVRLLMTAPSPRGIAVQPRGIVYRVLVIAQIAMTTALVITAALLAQSLRSVRGQDTGFAIDGVMVADIGLPVATPPSPRDVAIAEQRLLAALAARPDVRRVATAYDHPLEANWSETPLIVGDTTVPDQRRPAELRIVSPGYFDALDVMLLDGRPLTERDGIDAPGVVMINEAFATELGGRAIGRRLHTGTPRFLYGQAVPNEFEIVGIVGNERFRGLEHSAQPAFYLSTRQFPQQSLSLLIRTTGDPVRIAGEIRSVVRSVDAAITFTRPTSLERILAEQLGARRVTTSVIGGFAVAALALAGLGLYSLLRIVLARRTREIGIRLALGASPGRVRRQLLRDGGLSAAAGVVVGAALALAVGQLIQSLLVGVSAVNPATFGVVAVVLLMLALITAIGPASRAARIDPVEALRAE
jgi:putative ABC transport system permease protein